MYAVLAVLVLLMVVMLPIADGLWWHQSGLRRLLGPALLLLLVVALVGRLSSLSIYRVAGGRGELRLFEQHLEIPRARGARPLHMRYDGLVLELRRHEGRIAFQVVSVTSVLILRQGGQTRGICSRVFESHEVFLEAVEDIEALAAGERLPNRDSPDPAASIPDEYDERLEAELADV